ncbi:MAG: ferrochelatase [Acetobacteraceae bacterium]
MVRPKVAIVLFNMGGPDRPEAIAPFLRNLFSDPAILGVPWPVRPVLARWIAARRLGPARVSYAHLDGRSPLLGQTEEQGRLLVSALPEIEVRAFIAMRYWAPMSEEAARAVAEWDPDEIVLLPLYPHFSTTTTGSSLAAWRQAAVAAGLAKETRTICCWYADPAFVAAVTAMVARAIAEARRALPPGTALRMLFSAHGLPERIIRAGDPYRMQVEKTMQAVVAALMASPGAEVPESRLCFQSRATPERWLQPSTDDEIRRAGAEQTALLVVPIAFVSEHSETLVELDIDYRKLAEESGVPGYFRAPTPGVSELFIAALAGLVRQVRLLPPGLATLSGCGACGPRHGRCLKEVVTA